METQLELEKNTRTGLDKIKQYSWELLDKPGRLMMVQKDQLSVNHVDYQRQARPQKILTIANKWSWVACGALIVAERSGRLWIIDGQYRWSAACRRSDITVLPCIVFECAEVKAEATGFLLSNTNRKPISSLDRFKALLCTGDESALFVQELIDSSERKTHSGGSDSARCLTALLTLAKNDRPALIKVWPVVDELCGGRAIHSQLLRALVSLEKRMLPGDSLASKHWRSKLISCGIEKLIDGMRTAEAYKGNGGDRVWADGIVSRVNHGLRNKMQLTS